MEICTAPLGQFLYVITHTQLYTSESTLFLFNYMRANFFQVLHASHPTVMALQSSAGNLAPGAPAEHLQNRAR